MTKVERYVKELEEEIETENKQAIKEALKERLREVQDAERTLSLLKGSLNKLLKKDIDEVKEELLD